MPTAKVFYSIEHQSKKLNIYIYIYTALQLNSHTITLISSKNQRKKEKINQLKKSEDRSQTL